MTAPTTFPETFAGILSAMNKGQRAPAACTPDVCDLYRAVRGEDDRLLLNAILGFEVTAERHARPEDEPAILERRESLRANVEAAQAAQAAG